MRKEPNEKEIKENLSLIKITLRVILIISFIMLSFALISGLFDATASTSDYDYTFNQNVYYNQTTFDYNQNFNLKNQSTFMGQYETREIYNYTQETVNNYTMYLQPDTDVITQWQTTGTSHYTEIDDPYYYPSTSGQADYINCIDGDENDVDQFTMSTDTLNGTTWKITLWHLGFVMLTDERPYSNVYIDGAWLGNELILFNTGAVNWQSRSFYGNYSQSDIDAIQIKYTACDDIGMFGGAFIVNSYIEVHSYNSTFTDVYSNVSIPIYNDVNGSLEVDKWEFAFEGTNDFYDSGDTPDGWTEYVPYGDNVYISWSGTNVDKCVRIEATYGEALGGLYKDDFGLDIADNYTVSFRVKPCDMDYPTDGSTLEVYSYDDSKLLEFILQNDGSLVDVGNAETLNDYIEVNNNYDFVFYLDFTNDMYILEFYINDVYNDTYSKPLYTSGKNGLNEIRVEAQSLFEGYDTTLEFDSVGVYVNGSSIADELGYTTIYFNKSWYFERDYLLTVNSYGNMSLFGCSGYTTENVYLCGYSNVNTIKTMLFYNDTDVFHNLYDDATTTELTNASLVIFTNSSFSLSSLSIFGVNLTYSTFTYYPTFTYGNVDIDDSYFYVDGSHVLRYGLETDDTNLEYIQISFDITDVSTSNRSVYFKAEKNYNSLHSELTVLFDDMDYTSIEVIPTMTTYQYPLEQAKFVDKFIVLITDNDNNINHTITGYYKNLSLIYYPNTQLNITILTLINLIIALIIIIAPSLAIYRVVGKMALFPTMMLMTVICFIINLIPLWLLFFSLFTFVVLFYLQRKGVMFE